MKISVVLAMYNGKNYLEAQLDSLKNQTRTINEVLILDDCSTDDSIMFVESYISKYHLDNWKIIKNTANKGWKVNFYEGFNLAKGDIIFPCDQDDIWHSDKIEIMSKIMEDNGKINVLEGVPHKFFTESQNKIRKKHNNPLKELRISLGILLDKIDEKKNLCKNTGVVNVKYLDESFMRRAPGCTLAIRRDFFLKIRTEWFEELPHDALVAYYAKLYDSYYTLDYEVIDWRQHVGSASRPFERTKENRIKEINLDNKMISKLQSYSNDHQINPQYYDLISKASDWNKQRELLVYKGNIPAAWKLLKYHNFYLQFRRYFTDLKYGFSK